MSPLDLPLAATRKQSRAARYNSHSDNWGGRMQAHAHDVTSHCKMICFRWVVLKATISVAYVKLQIPERLKRLQAKWIIYLMRSCPGGPVLASTSTDRVRPIFPRRERLSVEDVCHPVLGRIVLKAS